MQTNKEHVRAHSFLSKRLVSAVVHGRPDGWEHPFGRSSAGTVIGLVLATLLVLGALVLSWIRPSTGPSLAQGTTVVVEKETGNRYLVDHGSLRPVRNLASALLAVGPELKIQTLSRSRTARLPRGPEVGVIGIPDDVPAAAGVVSSWWAACQPVPLSASRTPAGPPALSFGVGSAPTPLAPDDAVLVQGPDGDLHLAVNGISYPLDSAAARTALGYASVAPVQVSTQWLAGLRPGRAIRPIEIPDVGRPGPRLPGGRLTKVGQVLSVRTPLGAAQYFVVQSTSVVAVTQVEARLLLGNPKLAAVNPVRDPVQVVTEVEVADAQAADWPATQGWPASVPGPARVAGKDLCVGAGATGPAWIGTRPTTTPAPGGAALAAVPPGSGVVVDGGEPGSGATPSGVSFVDDQGRRYPVADDDTLAALGLATAPRLRVPPGVLTSVQVGPALDVATIRPKAS